MNFKLIFILLITCYTFQNLQAEKRKVLMIGNSYTSVNNLPGVLTDLALSLGDSLVITSSAPGGFTFNQHSTYAATLSLIAQGGWDYVVLQAQSQEPSFPPSQVATETYPYAKKLDSLIHVSSPCAETVFYMTWGKKNGDASNCAGYPILCTYAGVYSRLRESYLQMTQDNQATCAPVGVAWNQIITTNPSIELFNADGSHPNANGTYLTACTFYSSIFQKSCVGAQYLLPGVGNGDAFLFQTIASNIVLDSLENWQQYGGLPFAKYSTTNALNQYSFNNQSLRSTQYVWDFGDGSTINTQTNPSHTYLTNGVYQVVLKALNACGKYDTVSKLIQVPSFPSATTDFTSAASRIFSYQQGIFKFNENHEAQSIKISNLNGQVIFKQTIGKQDKEVPLSSLSKGIYFYQIELAHNKVLKGKFILD